MVAAPGWGKTTYLRSLVGAAPAIEVARPPAGWTPFSVARQLLQRFESENAVDGVDLPTRAAPDSADNPDQPAALAGVVCTVAQRAVADDTLVVVDDAEIGADDPLREFLEALILHLPPRLHLVLAARQVPPLRLARLKAAGEVAHIGSRDLAIGAADVTGLDADARRAIDEIAAATGGWPLAVRLAADVLQRGGPVEHRELVARLLAPDAVLFEYLAEEVLSVATDAERELLAIVAHLPSVSAPLLRALERADLAPLLARLGDAGTFVELDRGARDEFRATVVGREFLRRALPPPPLELLRRAIAVLRDTGKRTQAVELCTQLGDPAAVRELLASLSHPERQIAPDALDAALDLGARDSPDANLAELRGDLAYVRGKWDEALASYARAAALAGEATPRLARKRATILYLRGRLDEAEAMCVGARLDHIDLAEESQVLAWHAAIRWVRGDVDGCQALLDRAEAAGIASRDDTALATVHTTRAMLAALRGDRRANAESYRQAMLHAERAEDVVQIVRIRSNRGSHHMEEGDYEDALAELGTAIELAEVIGSETFAALAYANRGETLMRMGRLDDALRDLRRAEGIWERVGSHQVAYALGELGDVQALRGQRSDAIALYRQTVALAERAGDVQGLVPGLIGLAKTLAVEDPDAAMAAAERAIAESRAVSRPHAELAAGWIELRRGDRRAAAARAATALRLGQAQQDRAAVAESLLLQSSLIDPPDAAPAEEARRVWRDLGNPIGEARAALLLAERLDGAARADAVAVAEQLLIDAGAWGILAEVRQTRRAPDAPDVVIMTLGGFRVTRGGSAVEIGDWGSRKARDLVKLLVARRGAPVVRDEVAALLWPDEPDRSARRLSVLLSTIRGVLDPTKSRAPDHYVGADHDTVWLVREHVEVDLEEFLREATEGRRLLQNGETAKAEELLARAAARYLGDFCADDPYADWAAGARELARHTFVEVSAHLGRLADARGAHGDSVRHRLRILDVDPYDEDAHLDLIRALIGQRRHGEARRAYRTYCARLQELDLDPAPFPR